MRLTKCILYCSAASIVLAVLATGCVSDGIIMGTQEQADSPLALEGDSRLDTAIEPRETGSFGKSWATYFTYVVGPPPAATTANLYAGQFIDVGTLLINNDATSLKITYKAGGDWLFTETNLHVATSLEEIPQTKYNKKKPEDGTSPKIGHFDYSSYHPAPGVPTVTHDVGFWEVGTKLYICAHAVVLNESGQEETAWGSNGDDGKLPWLLPEEVTVEYASIAPSTFFYVRLSGIPEGYSIWDGTWYGWCADRNTSIDVGPYTARVYSSLDPLLGQGYDSDYVDHGPSTIDDDEQWDIVNYMLNQDYKTKFSGFVPTVIELQNAYWHFLDDPPPSEYWNTVRSEVVEAIIDDAEDNGPGFYPSAGQFAAVILYVSEDTQLVFFPLDP